MFGPSGATRTRGFHIPNVAPYQLGYTRIFGCHDYSTKIVRLKVFPVCGHLCGQREFLTRLCCLEKSSKRPCCKGFRALAVSIVDRRGNAPKPPALPTALIPVIGFLSGWAYSPKPGVITALRHPEICGRRPEGRYPLIVPYFFPGRKVKTKLFPPATTRRRRTGAPAAMAEYCA